MKKAATILIEAARPISLEARNVFASKPGVDPRTFFGNEVVNLLRASSLIRAGQPYDSVCSLCNADGVNKSSPTKLAADNRPNTY